MTDNFFSALAAEQISGPVKSRLKGVETRRARSAQAEKDLAEEAQLLKLYRRERKKHLQSLLDGPFGADVRGLMAFMRTMTLSSAPALVGMVRKSIWVQALPEDHKYILLRLVSHGIAKVREKNGLAPFDDGCWGEPPRAFEQVKQIIGVR